MNETLAIWTSYVDCLGKSATYGDYEPTSHHAIVKNTHRHVVYTQIINQQSMVWTFQQASSLQFIQGELIAQAQSEWSQAQDPVPKYSSLSFPS